MWNAGDLIFPWYFEDQKNISILLQDTSPCHPVFYLPTGGTKQIPWFLMSLPQAEMM